MRIALIIGAVLAFTACSPQPARETPEPTPVAEVELATVSTPVSGARVTSPLRVSGVAPAHPRVSWTDPGPKEFDAELSFSVTGPATLVLEEDMPGEGNEPRQVRIPVVLE